MKAVKDSGVPWLGLTPAHWNLNYLGNAVDVAGGATPSKERLDFWNGSIPWVSPKDMKSAVITDSEDHVTESALKGSSIRLVPAPAVLMVTRGMILDHTVPIAITARPVTLNQDMKALRPRSGLRADYLAHYLRAVNGALLARVEEAGHGTKALRTDLWRKLPLLIPPTDEQRAVVAFVDRKTAAIDALIAKKERLIELLHEKRQALITQAVTKGLDPNVPMKDSGVAWIGDTPAHWEIKRFKYVATIQEGQVDPEDEPYRDLPLFAPNHLESGTGRVLATESARDQGAESGKYLVREGDVLYSKIRPALRKVALAPKDGLCSADMYPIRPRRSIRAKFLMYAMLGEGFYQYSLLESDRVAMPKINRDALGRCAFPVAPVTEQDQIVAYLDRETLSIDSLRERTSKSVQLLAEYRQALVTAVVTGKIDVTREAA